MFLALLLPLLLTAAPVTALAVEGNLSLPLVPALRQHPGDFLHSGSTHTRACFRAVYPPFPASQKPIQKLRTLL